MARTQLQASQLRDKELTGASFVPELGFYDETKNYLSGDSVIWNNEKYICNTNVTGSTEGDLTNSPDISSNWDKQPNVAYSVYPSASEALSTSRITVTIDTIRSSSPYFSLSGSELTALSSGKFILSGSFAADNSTTTRCSASAFIQLDTGSGYADIPNYELNVYSRTKDGNGITTATLAIPIMLNAGDKLRMQAIATSNNALSTYVNGCTITIFGLDAISGPRGAQGIAGPSGDIKWLGEWADGTYNQFDTVEYQGSSYTCLVNGTTTTPPGTPGVDWDLVAARGSDGAGSTISVSENSSNIPNTPHGTLNFTGDITATDGGSGVADINVTFPKNTYMMPVWAEENGSLANNTYEWSFGNGGVSPAGHGLTIFVPSGYKCELVAMSLCLRQGTATVEALKNSTLLGSSANVSVSSGTSNTNEFTPVEYSNNDIINFRTTSANNTGSPNVVTAWLRFTEL